MIDKFLRCLQCSNDQKICVQHRLCSFCEKVVEEELDEFIQTLHTLAEKIPYWYRFLTFGVAYPSNTLNVINLLKQRHIDPNQNYPLPVNSIFELSTLFSEEQKFD